MTSPYEFLVLELASFGPEQLVKVREYTSAGWVLEQMYQVNLGLPEPGFRAVLRHPKPATEMPKDSG